MVSIKTLALILLWIFIGVVLIFGLKLERKYEYIDFSGIKGISHYCYERYQAGGLNCRLGTDSIIQVSQYKLVEIKILGREVYVK